MEVPIFAKGLFSRNWEVLNCGSHDDPENNMYFCFTSKKPYKVSESYKAFIDLKVPEDVMGIGADMKGILKAGTYKSESNFVLYHLEKQTGRKDVYAFLNNEDWKTLWELEKTADEGWMEEKYNPKKRLNLKSHKDVYSIELDFQKGTKCNISVVNHKTKEYFYEFFKNTDVGIFLPVVLTSIFVPSMIIKLLPFIIFISSMWFMIKIRNNKDLLILKIHGYSNIKIFFILAITSFLIGWIILFVASPFTSSMVIRD